jgi:hypothetical protein
MKWVLIIQICSFIEGSCAPEMQFPAPITSFYDCQAIAFDVAKDWIEGMDKNLVNDKELIIKTTCASMKPSI